MHWSLAQVFSMTHCTAWKVICLGPPSCVPGHTDEDWNSLIWAKNIKRHIDLGRNVGCCPQFVAGWRPEGGRVSGLPPKSLICCEQRDTRSWFVYLGHVHALPNTIKISFLDIKVPNTVLLLHCSDSPALDTALGNCGSLWIWNFTSKLGGVIQNDTDADVVFPPTCGTRMKTCMAGVPNKDSPQIGLCFRHFSIKKKVIASSWRTHNSLLSGESKFNRFRTESNHGFASTWNGVRLLRGEVRTFLGREKSIFHRTKWFAPTSYATRTFSTNCWLFLRDTVCWSQVCRTANAGKITEPDWWSWEQGWEEALSEERFEQPFVLSFAVPLHNELCWFPNVMSGICRAVSSIHAAPDSSVQNVDDGVGCAFLAVVEIQSCGLR